MAIGIGKPTKVANAPLGLEILGAGRKEDLTSNGEKAKQ